MQENKNSNLNTAKVAKMVGCNSGVWQCDTGTYGRQSILNGETTFKRLFIRRRIS